MSDEIEVDVVDESGKVYLTPEERYRINLSTEQFIVQERDKKIIELRLEVIRAQTELAKAQVIILSKDETILKMQAVRAHEQHAIFNDKSKQYMKGVAVDHGLPEDSKWGYNPETGEIVLE